MDSQFWWGVAASVLAAGIVAVLVHLKTRALLNWNDLVLFLRLTRRLRDNGVSNFFTRRSDYVQCRPERSISEYISTAEHSLSYVGFWLAQSKEIENVENAVHSLLRKGCTVELVLLDPELDDTTLRRLAVFLDVSHESLRSRISRSWEDFSRFRAGLKREEQLRFIMAHHNELLTASAFLFDYGKASAKTLVDYKLFGASREGSFGIELRPGTIPDSLYERITESYRKIRAVAFE